MEASHPSISPAMTPSSSNYSSSLLTGLHSPSPWSSLSDSQENTESFPGGSVIENLPANAGDTGLIPCSGKIPHTLEPLSLCATTIEPVLQRQRAATTEALVPWSPCSATREATAVRSLHTTTREQPLLTATREKPAHQ